MFTPLILSLMVANNMAASAAIFIAWQISTLRLLGGKLRLLRQRTMATPRFSR
jgi:hypothetical protein